MAEILKTHTILVLRPDPSGSLLCAEIERNGGKAIHLPTIAFAPAPDQKAFRAAIAQIPEQDYLIFISPQAVSASISAIRAHWPTLPKKVKFVAIGEGTAKALAALGYEAIYPQEWSSEGLLSMPLFHEVTHKKIAIVRGVGGREKLDHDLQESGALVLLVIAYQRIIPKIDIYPYLERIKQEKSLVIIGASFEAVKNLKIMFGAQNFSYLKHAILIVTSERIKKLAHGLDFQTIWVAENASLAAILKVLATKKE